MKSGRPKPSDSRKGQSRNSPLSYDDLVSKYLTDPDPNDTCCYAEMSPSEAIDAAGKCLKCPVKDGNMHSHQYRIRKTALKGLQKVLNKNVKQICAAKDFDDIYSIIKKLTSNITGIGDLTVYDTANRVGLSLKKLPTSVYLHCGALKGAKAVLGPVSNRCLPLTAFPPVFHRLQPGQMENFLCIYKEKLKLCRR